MKNQVIFSDSETELKRLEEEFGFYIGRDVQRYRDRLIVFCLPRPKKKKDDEKDKEKSGTAKERGRRDQRSKNGGRL